MSSSKQGFGIKTLAGVSMLVLIGGLILAGWVVTKFDLLSTSPTTPTVDISKRGKTDAPAIDPASPGQSTKGTDVASKVAELEERLTRIDAVKSGDSKSGGGTVAVTTALQARRLVEEGKPLGTMENQLRLHFGATRPSAVEAIRAVSADPTMVSNLRDDLARNGPAIIGRSDDISLWEKLKQESKELFVLRERGAVPTSPSQILQRAEQRIASGNISEAVEEISRLAPNPARNRWLADASRYEAAQRALDIIERAALASSPAPVEPQATNPASTSSPVSSAGQNQADDNMAATKTETDGN